MNATAAQTKSLEWLNRLRANPKIPLIVAGSAAVAVMVALILWAKAPDYRTLFSNLSDQDGGAIVSQLTQMNIPYRFSEASGAIEVPADKVHELRLRLAQQGLPKGGAVGFELLDQEKFGISQFSEQVNYQRALEGELAQKIIDEMFLFENLVDVDDRSIQRLLQEVDSESLLIALKGAEQPLREKFLRNMSQRAADILRDDLANRGPVRLSQVENEQKAILLIVRRLAETGEMVIGSGEDTYV
ncbi:flagellar M-ring protein FliF [Escherichia coli]|nr:flagellar M-ring protein FliF [Escherichia coli]